MDLQDALLREQAVLFGQTESLIGIVTDPVSRSGNELKPAVILLNPGIVHRVGPGRIYVKIARELAAIGFVVLRFDFSGIGDSGVRHDNLPFEKSALLEARDAMDFLQATRDIKHFIFLGGCSGALISLEIACSDPRVIGAVLINFPIAGDEDGQPNSDLLIRRAAHYYRHYALFDLKSWRNLLTGKTSYRNLSRVLRFQAKRLFLSEKKMSPQMPQFQVSLRRLVDRGVCLIFLCSEGDPLLDDLRQAGGDQLRQLCTLGKAALEIVPRSDHTFSSLDDQERLLTSILDRISAISSTEQKLMNCA